MSRPDGWITTRATAAVARRTTESGPGDGHRVGRQDRRLRVQAGRQRHPCRRPTGTLLETSGSSWTWIDLRIEVEDLDPRIDGLDVDLDGGERRPGLGRGRRQVDAGGEAAAGQPVGDVGRREVADVGHVAQIAGQQDGVGRLVGRHDRDPAGPDLGILGQDQAGIQERGQHDGAELERPVPDDPADDPARRSPHRPPHGLIRRLAQIGRGGTSAGRGCGHRARRARSGVAGRAPRSHRDRRGAGGRSGRSMGRRLPDGIRLSIERGRPTCRGGRAGPARAGPG